jgi:hypothetical protein
MAQAHKRSQKALLALRIGSRRFRWHLCRHFRHYLAKPVLFDSHLAQKPHRGPLSTTTLNGPPIRRMPYLRTTLAPDQNHGSLARFFLTDHSHFCLILPGKIGPYPEINFNHVNFATK